MLWDMFWPGDVMLARAQRNGISDIDHKDVDVVWKHRRRAVTLVDERLRVRAGRMVVRNA
jgi:hypothetical protein